MTFTRTALITAGGLAAGALAVLAGPASADSNVTTVDEIAKIARLSSS